MNTRADQRLVLGPVVGFCLYDFGYSAFTTIVGTFVFATYFAKGVAVDPVTGTGQWSLAMAVAGVLVGVLSPICGAIADQTGRRKIWLFALSLLCVVTTAMLWFVRPTPADVPFALITVILATVGFEMGMLFYNALLPGIAPPAMLGRISGWAWGIGYVGGLIALVIALFGLVQADPVPFGLDKAQSEPVRATSVLVAAWFAVFATPLFLLVKEPVMPRIAVGEAIRRAIKQLRDSLGDLRGHGNILRFLIAAMLYSDGVHTIFSLGGVYAGTTYGMDVAEVMMLGISLNITSGIGAFAFGWVDDKHGSKRTIIISLVCLLVSASVVLTAPSKTVFWVAALVMSTFFGPVQAASRTLMARLAPPHERGEMFGLFSLSGRLTAFAGPALVGWVTLATGSQRLGMATVLLFLGAGLWLVKRVRENL
ncbi:MAG: MFS transporter [Rhodospirillaceae bacterium]|nr:MAG: MFS transporter [Rhodospirillaceae bacterium]